MTGSLRLFCTAVAASMVMSHAAAAGPVYDGVTFEELQSSLALKTSIRVDKLEGRDVVWAQGKNHLIVVYLVHCTDAKRCDGVKYVSALDRSASPTFVNKYNRAYNYAKMTLANDGKMVVSLEAMTLDGVTAENIGQNALALMYRLTQLKEITDTQASLKPLASPDKDMLAAIAGEGRVGAPSTLSPRIEPALLKAFAEEIKASD